MQTLELSAGDRASLHERLAAMPAFLEATFVHLTAAEAAERGPDGTFSPVEQCWHLADLEREGYAVRLRRLQEEQAPMLADFDGDRLARERNYRALTLDAGLCAFREAREANLQLLDAVSAAQWTRTGTQEGVGSVALCDVPAMMAQHDAAHRAEIEAWRRWRAAGRATSSRARARSHWR